MHDFNAICATLAARYAPGTLATPAGGTAIRTAYGHAPHSLPATPAVVVMPQTGDVVPGSGEWTITHHVDVNFYLAKSQGDVTRNETQRQIWLPSLLSATLGAMTLSATIKSGLPTSYEFLELSYGDQLYDGITIHLDMIIREAVTMTA